MSPVLVCEQDLPPGSLEKSSRTRQHDPECIILDCFFTPDEFLFGEALNLGAWEVLAKPFDTTEVIRSVQAAWQHWYDLRRQRM